MIRCLLIQISRNLQGQPIRKELQVSGETIQIGRAAGCKIRLLDHRVNLHHAVILFSDEARLHIESVENSDILIHGSFQSGAELIPGMHVFVGPYELIVESPTQEYELVLSVEMVRALPEDQFPVAAKRAAVSLSEAGLAKRKPTFWLSAVIVLFCLWIPIMPFLALPGWVKELQILTHEPWQLGGMMRGHYLLKAKCGLCHQKPFSAVTDQACENCHKTIARHVRERPWMQVKNAYPQIACTECHHDHRGEKGQQILEVQCVTCHAIVMVNNESARLVDVRDFGHDHPAFSLTFKTGPEATDTLRIPQKDQPRLIEKSGLKFSHKLHLKKTGVSSPEGDTIMECQDCHEEAGAGFKPVSMEKNCQLAGCHALRFKPPAAGRYLPHGSVRNVLDALNDYHLARLIGGDQAACGAGKNKAERLLDCAKHNAAENAELLFKGDRGCVECHEITVDPEQGWKVAPLMINRHWLADASFTHTKHRFAKCASCHDKALSEKSADVSIPDIVRCRECHTGSRQEKNKISSTCKDCHRYHRKDKAKLEHS